MSTEEGNDKDLDNEIEDIWWALPYLTKLPIERFTSDNSTLAGLMFYCSKYFYLFSVRSLFTAVGTRKTRRQFSQASIKYLIIRYSEIHLQDVEKKPHRRRHHQARINHISSSSPCFALDTVRIPQAAAGPKVKTKLRTWRKLEIYFPSSRTSFLQPSGLTPSCAPVMLPGSRWERAGCSGGGGFSDFDISTDLHRDCVSGCSWGWGRSSSFCEAPI